MTMLLSGTVTFTVTNTMRVTVTVTTTVTGIVTVTFIQFLALDMAHQVFGKTYLIILIFAHSKA